MSKTILYFCDGRACDEACKENCYTNGGDCIHTVNKEHTITSLRKYIKLRRFNPGDNENAIYVETIDELKIIQELHNEQELDNNDS